MGFQDWDQDSEQEVKLPQKLETEGSAHAVNNEVVPWAQPYPGSYGV